MINFKGKYRPISPSFDNARKVHFDISGTELSFKFPKSDRECDDFDLVKSNTKIDIGDLNNEKNIHLICKGSWYFYGGYIFKRPLGFINIMISLFHNDRIGNLFIPENFENFNLELSTAMYGPKAGSGKIYEFPFEWTTERYNDMPWLTYKLKSNEEYNRDFTKIFSAPLEENKTLNIEFFLDASEPYKDTPNPNDKTPLTHSMESFIQRFMQETTLKLKNIDQHNDFLISRNNSNIYNKVNAPIEFSQDEYDKYDPTLKS